MQKLFKTGDKGPKGLPPARRNLLATEIRNLLFFGVVIKLVAIGGLLYWAASDRNADRSQTAQKALNGSLLSMTKRVEDVLAAFAYWPEATKRLTATDAPWLEIQIAQKLRSSFAIDLAGIDYSNAEPPVSWHIGKDGEIFGPVPAPALFSRLHPVLLKLPSMPPKPHAEFVLWRDRVYVIAAAYFYPESKAQADVGTPAMLLFGQELTERNLKALETSAALTGLQLSSLGNSAARQAVAEGHGRLLETADGQPVAFLHWTPDNPGSAILRQAVLPTVAIILLLLIINRWVTRLTMDNAHRLSEQEKRAFWLARHDSLTKLPNREALLEYMGSPQVLSECEAGRAAMMLIDITGLRDINNAVGQSGGNHLLRQVAERLNRSLPPNAYLSRTGGDEFDVLLLSPNPDQDMRAYAEVIHDTFSPDFVLCGYDFQVRAAVGYASSQRDFCSITELKRRCDLAVMEAKRTRSGVPLRYSPDLDTILNNHRDLEVKLRQAISNGDIKVYYQPIVCARTRTLHRVEALARWTIAETQERISPDIFISVAEQSGLISALGQSVLMTVCKDLQTWPQLKVSLNASPKELADPRFVARLIRTCRDHNIAPERLAIELTEGVLVTQPEVSRMRLNALRAAGFRIFLDDFGDGFSSIGYLRRLPFDTLKIDRSFTRDLTTSEEARQLIISITGIASALHMDVVAEGVETEEQAKLLQLTEINHFQGYLFGQPMTFLELINRYGQNTPTAKFVSA